MRWQARIRRGLAWRDLEIEQASLVEEVKRDRSRGFVLLAEPRPTFTHGRNANPADLLWSGSELTRHGIAVAAADRGGKWTYHGPGQIVLFPVFALESAGFARAEVRRLLDTLRDRTASYLSSLGITVDRREAPFGLYAGGGKLVSFGIAVHDGICQHGLALYRSDPTAAFQGILSCGVREEKFGSLEALGVRLSWETLALGLARAILGVDALLSPEMAEEKGFQ